MGNLIKLIFAQLIANGIGGWLARRRGQTTTMGSSLPPGPPPVDSEIIDGPSLPPPNPADLIEWSDAPPNVVARRRAGPLLARTTTVAGSLVAPATAASPRR
jgi:hypothetical protein